MQVRTAVMRAPESDDEEPGQPFGWLLALPPHSERTLRMEALIARLRLMVLAVNALALAFLLDTSGMQVDAAWWIVGLCCLYAIPTVLLEPYRRWRVFQTSFLTAAADSIVITLFIAVTGASESPFFLLYFLSATAVAMRFDLRQALAACLMYAAMYGVVYLWTWDTSADAFGLLALRCAYLFFISLGVGHLAREEDTRARQIEQIERLNEENKKLQTKQNRAARLDKLTGMLNRANFEKEALREIRRVKTSAGGYLSVLFCDMDRLKRVNDELGHDAGDRVLRAVCSALKHRLRGQDIIGRYGGDEFVVVLPNLTRETAYDRADQLIEGVRAVNELLPEALHIGLSVGIATYPFDAQDYATLVRVADQAMYLAKREGGDRVRTSNDLRLFWEDIPTSA